MGAYKELAMDIEETHGLEGLRLAQIEERVLKMQSGYAGTGRPYNPDKAAKSFRDDGFGTVAAGFYGWALADIQFLLNQLKARGEQP